MNRFERITRFLLYTWITILITMVFAILIKPTFTPTWFSALMWTLMYIWITLLLPLLLGFSYIFWNRMKRRLSKMTDKEIIEYWFNRKYSNFNP